ncbi:RNA polymerase sigma factor [Gordonia rhizosphera]|uniref:Putative RNA polymerase ECF-type sigma factor n=1 Tax=Gordonia rhizosphera NBRC 16068 TaxID=1108045 RepID=K6UZF2_9ACTN|nr:RNA polymerase sigma factor [Gordonia rhizosphera]GAB88868.1 putative RNA polymerase ECF-type sigma factor [Gordonia rhizosphera NBRC 16068]
MSGEQQGPSEGGAPALLAVYDDALPAVYGYLLRRCSDRRVAEDLTSETFLAAMDTVRRDIDARPSTGWLIGVARHKLADHWRARQRTPEPVEDVPETAQDDWDAHLDRMLAHYTLARMSPIHRAVLTLRYVDDLPVGDCAAHLDRTVGATEALLTRAKRAFRAAYPDPEPRSDLPTTGRGGHA